MNISKKTHDDLLRLNCLRAGETCAERAELEERFELEHACGSRLAVYGTLAPGRSNHREVADLEGHWVSDLNVNGDLFETEWAAKLGYPALRWSISGPAVPVELLISIDLVQHWPRLDLFEGPGYLRILVPLFRNGVAVEIANLYQCSTPADGLDALL